jgi:hypothetical protein
MPEPSSAFDRLVPLLEQIRERVELSPPDDPVTLSRGDLLVVLEMAGRMARGFQVLERRGLR